MLGDVKDLGSCPTCGRPRWRVDTCTCGHIRLDHLIGTRKGESIRTGCTRHGCSCARYLEAPDA